MRDPWIGVGAWVFAIVLVIAASRGTAYSFQVRMWPRWEIITVVVFGVIALALRVIYLDKIPWLVGGDAGAFGLGSLDILNGIANNNFGTDRISYPRLYFAIPAQAIAPLGNTISARWQLLQLHTSLDSTTISSLAVWQSAMCGTHYL